MRLTRPRADRAAASLLSAFLLAKNNDADQIFSDAYYESAFGEFVLPREAVRQAPSPDAALFELAQDTCAAAADPGNWNRAALACLPPGPVGL